MSEVGLEPTRGCPHWILSPPCSRTGTDTEVQGETKTRFYRVFLSLEQTRRDRERHPVAVKLRSKDDQGQEKQIYLKSKPPRFAGLLGARSAGLEPATFSVRSHSPSRTGRDSGGQGETKQRFYHVLALLEGHRGTGKDTRLRSDCGQSTRGTQRAISLVIRE